MKLKDIRKMAIQLESGDEGQIPNNINELLPDGWKICDGEDGTLDLRQGFSVSFPEKFEIEHMTFWVEKDIPLKN